MTFEEHTMAPFRRSAITGVWEWHTQRGRVVICGDIFGPLVYLRPPGRAGLADDVVWRHPAAEYWGRTRCASAAEMLEAVRWAVAEFGAIVPEYVI